MTRDRGDRDDNYTDDHNYDMSDDERFDERFTPPDPNDRWAEEERALDAALERYERHITREF